MLGLILTIGGCIAVFWAAYYLMVGDASAVLKMTDGFSVSSMTGGLVGIAMFTMGLIWIRD